jgi:hypothetical protein
MALGKTIDVSFSLEASGELFAPPGSNGAWASDTATPIVGYTLGVPEPPGAGLAVAAALAGCLSRRRGRRPYFLAAAVLRSTNLQKKLGSPSAF